MSTPDDMLVPTGLTFDDVLLLPAESDVLPAEESPHDESTGLVIDLRDPAAGRTAGRDDVRRPQRPRHPERVAPPVAMAPPRSLPRPSRTPVPPSPAPFPTSSSARRRRRPRACRRPRARAS